MRNIYHIRTGYAILVDAACIVLALAASFAIRFEDVGSAWSLLARNANLVVLSLAVYIPGNACFRLYQGLWRYESVRGFTRILAAGIVCTLVIAVVNFGVFPAVGASHCVSRSVILLAGLLNVGAIGGTRLAFRVFEEAVEEARRRSGADGVPARRVLVAGAGDAGSRIVREMRSTSGQGLVPIGFVDDDPEKKGARIHGFRVLGPCGRIPGLVKARRVDEVIIAMPRAPGSAIRDIRRMCAEAHVPCRTMPGIWELLDSKVAVKQLREVRIEDLLRRELVETDQAAVRAYVRGKRVLVTGAGGSIGSELCRQLARYDPELLILLGHGENSIFNIERELRRNFAYVPLQSVIADVRDEQRIDTVIGRYQPSVLFHAAAHKHVPLMEHNVEEAFTNNVLGTRCLLRAAEAHDVERFVMTSTDKAVNPTSVMGVSKRVAELLVHEAARRTGRPYSAVRFGNVLGSRGSAIPIFREQIAAGGPVTITHPEMRRFFMTIPEAVQLVLQAAVMGQGGEVFILNMGEPVKIIDLAKDLIELTGLAPGDDIDIVFTGLRPGEKLYEELLLEGEDYRTTQHEKIWISANANSFLSGSELERSLAEIAQAAIRMEGERVASLLRQLLPEHRKHELAGTK